MLTHLALGLGLAYPHAVQSDPDEDEREVFGRVPWPSTWPTGADAKAEFVEQMDRCQVTFETTAPDRPCWTYVGPGVASFWFRRAAIETAMHRIDVADALGRDDGWPDTDQAIDGVAETVAVVLPLAARLLRATPPPLLVRPVEAAAGFPLGAVVDGATRTTVEGSARSLLARLWGRPEPDGSIDADRSVTEEWVALIGRAFAGR